MEYAAHAVFIKPLGWVITNSIVLFFSPEEDIMGNIVYKCEQDEAELFAVTA